MLRFAFALVCLLLAGAPADAWNSKGHMTVNRLAWNELTLAERSQIHEILKRHPHYDEYLKADRPENIPEEEWVFLRAGAWSDWVRGGKGRAFNQPSWHYVNLPIIPSGDPTKPPELPKDTIINRITVSKKIVQGGNQEQRAIHLCWLCHLVADIHQPLHCVALYSKDFPDGDRGGNLALLRVEGRVIKLHAFWDDLLGTSPTQATLARSEQEIAELLQAHPDALKDVATNLTPASWAMEGHELAKRLIYQDGELKPAHADRKPENDAIPDLPRSYAEAAGQAARLCVAKAGKRLTTTLREALATK